MPTSTSPKRSASGGSATAKQRPSFVKPLIGVVVVAVIAVFIAALPASMIRRFLPPSITAEDFSGTVWHGSAGRIAQNSLSLGAVEWRLHPAALLTLTASADVHWVKGGFVADGTLESTSKRLKFSHLQGTGPIDDLADLGLGRGWRGSSNFHFTDLELSLGGGEPQLVAAVGELSVADLSSPRIADGADLGGYDLRFADGAITPDSDLAAELNDTGGPLELRATLHLAPGGHSGMLSGTVRARPGAPASVHREIDNLAQLRPRDPAGRVPIDLEFTL